MGSSCSCVGKRTGSVGKYSVKGDPSPTTPPYGGQGPTTWGGDRKEVAASGGDVSDRLACNGPPTGQKMLRNGSPPEQNSTQNGLSNLEERPEEEEQLWNEKDKRDEINRKLKEGNKNTVNGGPYRPGHRTEALVEHAKRLSNRLSALGSPLVADLGDGGPSLDPQQIAGTLSAALAGGLDMAELSALVTRLEAAVAKLEAHGATASTPPAPPPRFSNGCTAPEQSTVPFVVAYDTLLSGPFKTFLEKSNAIGADVAEMAKLVETAFRTQRAFLVMASKSAKPSQDQLPKVLEATGKQIQEVINFREKKRTSPQFNHLSAVSESIPGLSWVAVEPAPSQYCREMMNAAVFYTNRVLKDFREKDKLHVEWVQAYTSVFSELCDYIKEHHTTGVSWNPRGGAAVAAPPPPPPGVPPPPPMVKLEPKVIKEDPTAQLFQDINKGLDITSTLKKVSDDQKTHKNPSLREGPKPFIKSASPQPKSGASAPPAKPPRMQLEGKKWFVEYQKDNKNIVLSQTSMEQSVYVFRCEGTVVQVKGKINSIILDSCKKTAVVFDSLVSSLEVVNCQSCQAQVLGTVPTIAIEKTDGCMVYLSQDSLGAEIVTAKSSEMNILLPTPSGEFSEHPVPEQFKTLVQDGKLVTTCTEKAGN